jgi:hypothetical protein
MIGGASERHGFFRSLMDEDSSLPAELQVEGKLCMSFDYD